MKGQARWATLLLLGLLLRNAAAESLSCDTDTEEGLCEFTVDSTGCRSISPRMSMADSMPTRSDIGMFRFHRAPHKHSRGGDSVLVQLSTSIERHG